MTPTRVIIAVEGGAPTGGAERIAFDTVRVLSDTGIPVVIVSSAKEVDPEFGKLPGVTVEALNLPLHFERFFNGGKKHMIANLLEDHEMKALFSSLLAKYKEPGTIYHAHGFHNYFTQASLHAAVEHNIPTLVTCHDFGITCPNATLFNYQANEICELKPLSIACLRSPCMGVEAKRLKQLRFARNWSSHYLSRWIQRTDLFLAVSDFERDILRRQMSPRARIETLHNPVEPAAETRQNPAVSRHYLWIGRMTAEKDAITPAKTCRDMKLPITFVGDGPLRKDIEAANPSATFAGWLPSHEVKKAQCAARALIMSSKWHETASLVVLECLAAGIPCVVPDTSAAVSWVGDGVNGLYFRAGDQDSLSNALSRLQDDETVEAMSRAAFERYWSSPFTLDRYRDDLLSAYDRVLGGQVA